MSDSLFGDDLQAAAPPPAPAPAPVPVGASGNSLGLFGPELDQQDLSVGKSFWRDSRVPVEQRVDDYLASRAQESVKDKGTKWSDVWDRTEAGVRTHFPGVDPGALYDRFSKMTSGAAFQERLQTARAREAAPGGEETAGEIATRGAIPFGSTLLRFEESRRYGEALNRVRQGMPQGGDEETIAEHEQRQKAESQEGMGKAGLRALSHLPGIVGEGQAGGAILKGLGLAPAISFGARAAAAPAAELTARGAALGLAKYGLRTGIQTAAMPSMYLPEAAQRAAQNGGEWSDLKNLGPAAAMGVMQVAVLGGASHAGQSAAAAKMFPALAEGGATGYLSRLFASVGTGVTGQQAIDAASSIIGWRTGYGVAGDILNGRDDALKHAFVLGVTFLGFGFMHAHHNPVGEARTAQMEQMRGTMGAYLDKMADQGYSRNAAGQEMLKIHLELGKQIRDGDFTGKLPENLSKAGREYSEKLASQMDAKGLADEQAATETPQTPPEAPKSAAPESPTAPENATPEQAQTPEAAKLTPEESAALAKSAKRLGFANLDAVPPKMRVAMENEIIAGRKPAGPTGDIEGLDKGEADHLRKLGLNEDAIARIAAERTGNAAPAKSAKEIKRSLSDALLDEPDNSDESLDRAYKKAGYKNVDGFWVHPHVDPEIVRNLTPEVKQRLRDGDVTYFDPDHSNDGSGASASSNRLGDRTIRGIDVPQGPQFKNTVRGGHFLHELGHHVWQTELSADQKAAVVEQGPLTEHGKRVASGHELYRGKDAIYRDGMIAEEDFAQRFAENGGDKHAAMKGHKAAPAKPLPQIEGMDAAERLFTEQFPGAKRHADGWYKATVGETDVFMEKGEAPNSVHLDFRDARGRAGDRTVEETAALNAKRALQGLKPVEPGVGESLRADTLKFLRPLREFIGKLKAEGKSIEYTAKGPGRQSLYAKALTKAGYEVVPELSDPDAPAPKFVWRPKADVAEPNAQPAARPPVAESDPFAALAQHGVEVRPEPPNPHSEGLPPAEPPKAPKTAEPTSFERADLTIELSQHKDHLRHLLKQRDESRSPGLEKEWQDNVSWLKGRIQKIEGRLESALEPAPESPKVPHGTERTPEEWLNSLPPEQRADAEAALKSSRADQASESAPVRGRTEEGQPVVGVNTSLARPGRQAGEGEVPATIQDKIDAARLSSQDELIIEQAFKGNSLRATLEKLNAQQGRITTPEGVRKAQQRILRKLGSDAATVEEWMANEREAAKANMARGATLETAAKQATADVSDSELVGRVMEEFAGRYKPGMDPDEFLRNVLNSKELADAIDADARTAAERNGDDPEAVRREIREGIHARLASLGIRVAPEAANPRQQPARPEGPGAAAPVEPGPARAPADVAASGDVVEPAKPQFSPDQLLLQQRAAAKAAAKAEADAAKAAEKAAAAEKRMSYPRQVQARAEREIAPGAGKWVGERAEDLLKSNVRDRAAVSEMLRDARDRLDNHTDIHRQGTAAMDKRAEDWLPGLDEVAPLVAEAHPGILDARDPEGDLLQRLKDGNPKAMTPNEAHDLAFRQIAEEHLARLDQETNDAARQALQSGERPGAVAAAIQGGEAEAKAEADAGRPAAGAEPVSEPEEAGRGDEPEHFDPAALDFDPGSFGMGAAGRGGRGGAPPAGTPRAAVVPPPAPLQKPQTSGAWFRGAVDFLKSFGQKSFPALTRQSPETANKLAAATNSRWAAKASWDLHSRTLKVGNEPLRNLDPQEQVELGTTWAEYRVRTARENLNREIAAAKDPVTRAELEAARDEMVTFIRPDGPLPDEATYQHNLENLWSFFEGVKQDWTPEVEANYRGIKGLAPADAIDSNTQIPGLPLNLIAVKPDAPGAVRTAPGRSGMSGLRLRSPGFTRQATLNGEAYDTNIFHMMQRTLELGIKAARRAEAVRQGLADGVIVQIGGKGGAESVPDGFKYLGLDPQKGIGIDPSARYYAHPEAYADLVRGLEIGERGAAAAAATGLKPTTDVIYNVALMSPVELLTHGANHVTALFRPGMGTPIWNLRTTFANGWKILNGDPVLLGKVKDLTAMSAGFGHEARPGLLSSIVGLGKYVPGANAEAVERFGERASKIDPTRYINQYTSGLIDVMQKAVRVQLADAYDKMVEAKVFPESESAKRDFINQALGNYNAQAANPLAQFLRDSGLQSFATAAHTFTIQGVKSVLGTAVNAPTTSMRTQMATRAAGVLKLTPYLAMGPVINLLAWHNAFPDNVPAFAIKTGDDDKKVQYFDPLAFTGLRRGAKAIGLSAGIEGVREGKTAGQIADQALLRDAPRSLEHMFAGPPVQALHTLLTGEDAMGRRVAPKVSTAATPRGMASAAARGAPAAGSSQWVENLKAAGLGMNPILKTATQPEKNPRTWIENIMQSMGPFGVKTRDKPAGRRK